MLKTFLVLLLFAALPQTVLAQTGCEPAGDIPVNVTPLFEDPQYDFNTDIGGIRYMLQDPEHGMQESHDTLPLGVTHYQPVLEFRMPVTNTTYSDGTGCVQVQQADVTIGYRRVTVYIAREVEQGSCGFNEVMAHEQKHINVNMQILQEYAPMIARELKQYIQANGTFREESSSNAVPMLQERLQEILNNFGQQMIDANRDRQSKIDSAEEYRRLSASCGGQLARVAEHFWNQH